MRKRLVRALGQSVTVLNVGAGAGGYEPTDREVLAVEPSPIMIAQRRSAARVVRAHAEALPFADDRFAAAMAVMVLQRANVKKAKGTIQDSVAQWIQRIGPNMSKPRKR